jgi:hypothetical protein
VQRLLDPFRAKKLDAFPGWLGVPILEIGRPFRIPLQLRR